MKKPPHLSKGDSLSEAARLMIESSIRELPVFERKNLVGFVTDENIIHTSVLEKWGNKKSSRVHDTKAFSS